MSLKWQTLGWLYSMAPRLFEQVMTSSIHMRKTRLTSQSKDVVRATDKLYFLFYHVDIESSWYPTFLGGSIFYLVGQIPSSTVALKNWIREPLP